MTSPNQHYATPQQLDRRVIAEDRSAQGIGMNDALAMKGSGTSLALNGRRLAVSIAITSTLLEERLRGNANSFPL
jgi:hypothetical protein